MSTAKDARIDQFRKMAEADPNNELGHFSLGKALLETGQFKEATVSLSRALALNPALSKAHQMLGEAWMGAGLKDRAIDAWQRGVSVADEQGDRMPRDVMVQLLQSHGASVPVLKSAGLPAAGPMTQRSSGAAGFQCSRCGKPGDQLDRPPFKGSLGEKVARSVCKTCWREWIPMGTKVINELGLALSNPEAQTAYDQYMVEFLQIEE